MKGGENSLPDVILFCDDALVGLDGANVVRNDTGIDENGEPDINSVCKVEKDTDYYGNTYHSSKKDTAKECCFACQNDTECQSWTYDIQEQICRLKSKGPSNITPCPSRISGTVITKKPNQVTNTNTTKADETQNKDTTKINQGQNAEQTQNTISFGGVTIPSPFQF